MFENAGFPKTLSIWGERMHGQLGKMLESALPAPPAAPKADALSPAPERGGCNLQPSSAYDLVKLLRSVCFTWPFSVSPRPDARLK